AKQANGQPTVLRRFNAVAVEHAVKVTPKDTDPTGMIFVLAHDKDAVLNGSKPFQPLALRTNVGECDAVTLTSELTDANSAGHYSQVNIHIHHVQFDTQASDGVITGMSYEQAVRPYKVEDPQLTAAAATGATVLHLSSVTKFQVGESIGVGLGTEGPAATGTSNAGLSGQGPEIRTITAINLTARAVTLSAPLLTAHPAGQWAGTEFVQYRWYPDVNLDNIFFHDHVDGIHTWAHGLVGQLITEPKGSTYNDPRTGAPVDSGTIVDIRTTNAMAKGAGVSGSFREMALWTMDKGFGATNDSLINLRANPLTDRITADPSLKFSSYAYGDPLTPLPRAFAGDPFVIRAISVAPTVDTLHVDGHTFGYENRYVDSAGNAEGASVDTLHYGISEKYSMVLHGGAGGTSHLAGDYLYFNGIDRRITDGAWGIIRVLKGKVTNNPADPNYLLPLPGTTPGDAPALPTQTGGPPPEDVTAASPCPTGANPHAIGVTATRVPGVDNSVRLAYVPTAQLTAVLAGTLKPQPLVLHLNAGDCVSVTVTNRTSEPRISFHLAGLGSGIASSGADVGWNPETTIATNASRTYSYYVDYNKISGGSIADLSGSNLDKQGLYGAYTVAPTGSIVTDPVTGGVTDVGTSVVIHPPGVPAYRDHTLIMSDNDPQIGASFMPYPVTSEKPQAVRVNYRQAPRDDRSADAFNSAVFGDPATPMLTGYAGDTTVIHTLGAPGSEQMHSVNFGGQSFSLDPNIPNADSVETRGVGPWEMLTATIAGGAGGATQQPGDYFYGDMRRVFTKAGMWGLQRVLPVPATCPQPGLGLQCLQSPIPSVGGVAPTATTAPAAVPGTPVTSTNGGDAGGGGGGGGDAGGDAGGSGSGGGSQRPGL
ncbi:MAG: hypothetical protein QOE89_1900, partial [Pseudonocardiales bacterium]|nr:hypothetical protein [Pseudonocardiales bacterium]